MPQIILLIMHWIMMFFFLLLTVSDIFFIKFFNFYCRNLYRTLKALNKNSDVLSLNQVFTDNKYEIKNK